MITFAVLGLGNRGSVYSNNIVKHDNAKILSVCDVSRASLKQARELYGVKDDELFSDEEKFFEKKRADVLIVATLDGLHCRQTVKALSLGYDVLLEKPVAPTMKECDEIYAAAKKYGRDVVVCHNLRYTPFYQKFKTLIADGVIGEVLSAEQAENVAYSHYMCSFIRGKWHSSKETSPIILAKCCHDLDIISWFVDKKDEREESFGALEFYTGEHKPEGTPKRCLDCKLKDCRYNAYEFSVKAPGTLCVPYGFEFTPENIADFLRPDDNLYGQCVFSCPNDVCDRQTVNISFDGGVTANLLMHGFSLYETYRITRVFGSKGRLSGRLEDGTIRVSLFDGTDKIIDINEEIEDKESHSGGDSNLVADYISYLETGNRPLGISELADSLQSHRLAFGAEEKRLGHPLPKTREVKGRENPIENGTSAAGNTAGGIYATVAEFIGNHAENTVKTVSMTVNCLKEDLKEKIGSDMAFISSLIGAKAYKCDKISSPKGYPHGFIITFFDNGAIARYSFTCSPLKERTEISVFAPSANIYADTEKNEAVTKVGDIFASDEKVAINGKSFLKGEVGDCLIKNEISDII